MSFMTVKGIRIFDDTTAMKTVEKPGLVCTEARANLGSWK